VPLQVIIMFTTDLKYSVTRFRYLNATDRHTMTQEQHGDVKSVDFGRLSFVESHAIYYLCCRTVCLSVCLYICLCLSVCVSFRFICWNVGSNVTIYDVIIWRSPKHHRFQFPTISNNNMADRRICEALTTQASLPWGKSINVYGHWNIRECVRRCVSEVEGEGKCTVRLSYVGVVLVCECEWMSVLIKCNWMWREWVLVLGEWGQFFHLRCFTW
jgi:hypothetical protein